MITVLTLITYFLFAVIIVLGISFQLSSALSLSQAENMPMANANVAR